MSFIEERISEQFSFGSGVESTYKVTITETAVGNEDVKKWHPYRRLTINLNFTNRTDDFAEDYIQDLFDRAGGIGGGFRWKNPSDYSTNGRVGTPAFNDQICTLTTGTSYQIIKWYGTQGVATSPQSRLRKPVDDTVLVGIRDDFSNDVQIVNDLVSSPNVVRWSVDVFGVITFAANVERTINGITAGASTIVDLGASHGVIVDDSLHFSSVPGMTEINGLRGTVTAVGATTATVDIDSSSFTAFSLASPNVAVVNTAPQENELVVAGCYFDVPVRFDSTSVKAFVNKNAADVIASNSVRLIELLDPKA